MANIVLVNRHSNRHLDDVGAQQYWKFECVSGGEVWSGVKGYASRYYFYREKYKDDVEKAPWFFGHLGRTDARVLLSLSILPYFTNTASISKPAGAIDE